MVTAIIGQRIAGLPKKWLALWMLALAGAGLAVFLSGVLSAQEPPPSFESRSDGSDGALSLTVVGTVVFDPVVMGLDPDGDNIYHFTTIEIGPATTVTMSARQVNGPIYWLAQGDVTIDGTIVLSGQRGNPGGVLLVTDRRPSIPGPGGFPGGVGALLGSPRGEGFGPGGGIGDSVSAGHATGGANGSPTYGNIFVVPLIGGSGGAGRGGDSTGGGAGGGALLIASDASVQINGEILAHGGESGLADSGLFAGAGSGGAIKILAPVVSGNGKLSAIGGERPSGGPVDGGSGRIRIEAFEHNFTGTSNPTARLGTPFLVLPTDEPVVRIVSVAGQAVPAVPAASFEFPDAVFDQDAAVAVEIEAKFIPPGTVVQLRVFSENDVDQVVASIPLVGTLELSTATANLTFPFGFSRMLVEADWAP